MPSMAASRKCCAKRSRSASNSRTPLVRNCTETCAIAQDQAAQAGHRLVYSVEDDALVVLVLAVDKREDMAAYRSAVERLLSGQ